MQELEIKILAKSKSSKNKEAITLKEHTKGLLQQLKNLKFKVCKEFVDYNLLKFAIYSHDLGKVAPSFQISVGNWDYKPKVPFPEIPHSVFSLLWINKNKLSNEFSSEEDIKILLSVIAFHHWRDNFHNIILGNDDKFKRVISELLKNKTLKYQLLQNLTKHFSDSDKEFSYYLNFLSFDADLALAISEGNDLFPYVIPPYYSYFLPQRISINEEFKKKWIYTAGLLMRIDHFTSFIQEEGLTEEIEKQLLPYGSVKKNLQNELSTKLNKQDIKDDDIWQVKFAEDNKEENIILIAPTGSGKTEFAYLWAGGSKFFFTLPLRSAVNSMFERTKKIFGELNVGLLHSDADVYLYESSTNQEGENFRILDLARQLSLPVLVSTGDQVFPSALRYPGYEKIYATLGYSRLVIDEVQAYDPRAVAIIIKLIEDIVKLGGKFLLMTATLPPFVMSELYQRVGKENFDFIDKYEKDSDFCKHIVEIRESDIKNEDVITEILDKAKKGNRVLLILNTVETAQELYESIKKKNNSNIYLKLLHSRFTFNDRKKLEDEIVGCLIEQNGQKIWKPGEFSNPKPDNEEKGKILIATQLVEASLDIDADILYTELAPIDSLVQRMGRVLRRIKGNMSSDKMSFDKNDLSTDTSFGQNDLQDGNSKEANVFIFYQKPDKNIKLSSGAGTVYQNDLLVFSLAQLFKASQIISEKEIQELKQKYWQEKNDKKQKSKADYRDTLKKFLEDLFNSINNNGNKTLSFNLSEFNKKELVEKLYDSLPKESDYLQRFYQTLDILDAGYMSEKKKEALKIFREIYTVPAVPSSRIDEFKDSIETFLNEDHCLNYTHFKKEIISEYVVNIDIRKYYFANSLNLKSLSYIAYELKTSDEEKVKKMKRWLSDIYIFEGIYDKKKGVIFSKNENEKFSGIIDI